MLKCILGERKSGKSIFVEEQMKKESGNVLYVATLPDLTIYQETIVRHQERRPPFWDCIELFEMSAKQIKDFPYHNYRQVMIDNLSYYMLFQRVHNEAAFLREWDEGFFLLIDEMARNQSMTVYFVDTPFEKDILKRIDKEGIIKNLFIKILDSSQMIERFYHREKVYQITTKEGNDYLFHIQEGKYAKVHSTETIEYPTR